MTQILEPFKLADDIVFIPVTNLSEEYRQRLSYEDGDIAVLRPGVRSPASIINAFMASLLEGFKQPSTIARAIAEFSKQQDIDPNAALEDALPVLQDLINARLLFLDGDTGAQVIQPSLKIDDHIDSFRIQRCVHITEDRELYQAVDQNNKAVAIKLARGKTTQYMFTLLTRETEFLKYLNGEGTPGFVSFGTYNEQPYLAIEWRSGVPCAIAADEFRNQNDMQGKEKLLTLCCNILQAYVSLENRGIFHGDIHPNNILVDSDGTVSIIDFGLASRHGKDNEISPYIYGAASYFIEPEAAEAMLNSLPMPLRSSAGEQFRLGVLLYYLVTGREYFPFSALREDALKQIIEQPPQPFTHYHIASWASLEDVLGKALQKKSADRYASIEDCCNAMQTVTVPKTAAAPTEKLFAAASQQFFDTFINKILDETSISSSLLRDGLPEGPTCSVIAGAAGIAYCTYRIALRRSDPALISLSELWCEQALSRADSYNAFYNDQLDISPKTIGTTSPYHTVSGIHATRALIANAAGDEHACRSALDSFLTASKKQCDLLDLMTGKTATALACSLLTESLPDDGLTKQKEELCKLGHQRLDEVWSILGRYAPISECSEIEYLGIAHGWAGFCYATMRCHVSMRYELPSSLEARLEQLARCSIVVGRGRRWPWVLHMASDNGQINYMPGWCNGSAGYVYLWGLCFSVFGDNKYAQLAEQAAWNVWEEAKGSTSLCCGLAGRAYALLKMYKISGEDIWLRRAAQLAELAARSYQHIPNSSDTRHESLFRGAIGIALLLSEFSAPTQSYFPFFEEEPI